MARKPPADLPADTCIRKVAITGNITLDNVFYKVGVDHAFQQVLVVTDGDRPGDKIIVTDLDGRSSPSTPDPHPERPTSATAAAPDDA